MSVIDLRATVTSDGDGTLVLQLTGEVDIESASLINTVVDTALREGESTVVLDLSGVSFLDSRGVRALLIAHRSAERRGSTLTIRGARRQAIDVLMMTGCEHVLNLERA